MADLIQQHYSGNDAANYVRNRRGNDKWIAEQQFIEDCIARSDVQTVIDAPLGTNRFSETIEGCDNVTTCIGLELSDDMLEQSCKNNKSTKLEILKFDITETFEHRADLVISARMLNLVPIDVSLLMFANLLNASDKYCVVTLRTGKKQLVDGKVHVHPLSRFKKVATINGFVLDTEVVLPTAMVGDYRLMLFRKI